MWNVSWATWAIFCAIGDLIFCCRIHQSKTQRLTWTMGIVEELLPGWDGSVFRKTRAAKVRTPRGAILERAIQCLYPTEVQSNATPDETNEQDPTEKTMEESTSTEETADTYSIRGEHVGNSRVPTTVTRLGRRVYAPQRYGIS